MDAVRRNQVAVEHPRAFKQADRTATVLLLAIFKLLPGFGQMDMD